MDLFDNLPPGPDAATTAIAPGAVLLPGVALGEVIALLQAVEAVLQQAPLRHMQTPGGFTMSAPIVSLSLGLPAVFLFGTPSRKDRPQRYRLAHGDGVVWGGPSRLAFHGVAALAQGEHALLGRRRINLTFRQVRQRS